MFCYHLSLPSYRCEKETEETRLTFYGNVAFLNIKIEGTVVVLMKIRKSLRYLVSFLSFDRFFDISLHLNLLLPRIHPLILHSTCKPGLT